MSRLATRPAPAVLLTDLGGPSHRFREPGLHVHAGRVGVGGGVHALRVGLDEAPGVVARVLQGELGLESELAFGEVALGGEVQDVPGPSRHHLVGDLSTDGLVEGPDDVQDGRPFAGANVPCLAAFVATREFLTGAEVGDGEVDDVNVVPDRGAVVAVVVVTKDTQNGSTTDSDLGRIGQEIVGHSEGILSEHSGGVSPGRVEITQESCRPVWQGIAVIGDDALDDGLCAAIRVCGPDRALFRNRYHILMLGSVSVDCGRAGEDDPLHVVLSHGSQERDRTSDIDSVVFQRDL